MSEKSISRQSAIDLLKPFRDCMVDQWGCPISDVVYALDKAIEVLGQEERKRGEWYLEEYPDGYYQAQCSECGFIYNEDAYNNFRFCPRCGADMRGEDDGTD